MARFRLDSIGELARQMRFASPSTRNRQIHSAEALLHDIEPSRAYPLDFIIFRITGYHPRNVDSNLLTGLALQHDLGLLIETVSATLELSTVSTPEPVLTIDDVTERFNVTSKTIQRWRRKGLPSRRFIFPDGKSRVGFLLSSVERFISRNHGQIAGGNISRLSPAEHNAILRHARRLARGTRCTRQEMIHRIGRRLGRTPLAILHTLKKHDTEHPESAILPRVMDDPSPAQRSMILRTHRRGVALRKIARRVRRPRTDVYRVILEQRINRLLKKKMRFHDDPLYHQPDAAGVIDAIVAQEALPEPTTDRPRIPRDLPAYLAELYRVPLLTPARERGLFLKLNFQKYQFMKLRREIDLPLARRRDLNALEHALSDVIATRNQIIRANLRLVVSVARRHLRPGLNLMELVSEGNLVLLRAVDAFDVHRNTRFSTYATFALMKGFARGVPRMMSPGKTLATDPHNLAEIPDRHVGHAEREVANREQIQQLLPVLSERERKVLLSHYGVCERHASYQQLSERFGLSRQRIRQIEKAALAKLRAAAGEN